MWLESKKVSFLILALTSLACSRTLFFLFEDPEGPNLLIVVVLAAVLLVVSLAGHSLPGSALRKLFAAVAVQVLAVGILYFFLS